ncbi:MAG TPA: glycosyltransferase family 2 protein [Byssovorax sp.]|jgi:glycosyltransferase involved in cell wall biosynthesis
MQFAPRPSIAVVVPARDEALFIEEVVRGVPAFVDHVIVVDDASRDATAELARRAGGDRVRVVSNGASKGVGAAIARGYREARALGADVIAVMAGDGQMDPRDLAEVVAPVASGAADYVKGNRVKHPSAPFTMPLGRLVGTTVFGQLTAWATGLGVGDSQCGYTAIAARAVDALELDALWPGYGYPNDLLSALAGRGLRVAEVVVRPVYRGEASGLRARHLLVISFLIGRAAARRGQRALARRTGAEARA